jgi:hypothetical protein
MSTIETKKYSSQKKVIFFKGFFCIVFCCIANALLMLIASFYLFKTRFARALEFVLPFKFLGLELEFPFIKKRLLLLLIVLSLSTILSKMAVDQFEEAKLEYKTILAKENLIDGPQEKSKEQQSKDYWKAMLIVAALVLIRNFLREPRELFQYIFNNAENLDFPFTNQKMRMMIILLFSIALYISITIIELASKATKIYENKKCEELLSKSKDDLKKKKKTVKIVKKIKEKLVPNFLKKYHKYINDAIIIAIAVFFGLICAKIFESFKLCQNIQLTVALSNNFFFFIDNSRFLLTNIFFDFFFMTLIASLFSTNLKARENESFEIADEKLGRTFLCCFVNAGLFAVGLGSTILIENFIAKIDNFENFFDFAKIFVSLVFGYMLIVSSYTLTSSVCQIQDLQEVHAISKTK